MNSNIKAYRVVIIILSVLLAISLVLLAIQFIRKISATDKVNEILAKCGEHIDRGIRLAELLKRPNINYEIFREIDLETQNLNLSEDIAGEVEAEVLRNVVYASNCLINACKTINEDEVQELKDLIQELEKRAKEDE